MAPQLAPQADSNDGTSPPSTTFCAHTSKRDGSGLTPSIREPRQRSIQDLPDELLVLVFLETLRVSYWHQLPPYAHIRIAHICRRWRDVALHCSRLWNDIVVTRNQECLDTVVKWSNEAPLTVTLRDDDGYWYYEPQLVSTQATRAVQLASSSRHRLREFDITIPNQGSYPEILAHLVASFPALEKLSIEVPFSDEPPDVIQNSISLSVLASWPRLRELVVYHLHFLATDGDSRQTLDLQFFKMVGASDDKPALLDLPALQSFFMMRRLFLFNIDLTSLDIAAAQIGFPVLMEIRLGNKVDVNVALLNTVHFPVTTCVNIFRKHLGNASLISRSAISALSRDEYPRFHSLTCHLDIYWHGLASQAIAMLATFDSKEFNVFHRHLVPLDVSFGRDEDSSLEEENILDAIQGFVHHPTLQRVHLLRLTLSHKVKATLPAQLPHPVRCAYVFNVLRDVHTLVIHSYCLYWISGLLGPIYFAPTQEPTTSTSQVGQLAEVHPQYAFPALRHLVLDDVSFTGYDPRFWAILRLTPVNLEHCGVRPINRQEFSRIDSG